MSNCIMCKKEEKDLDFLGRCDVCFKEYMTMPEDQRPKNLGIPFVPIYNGGNK